MHAAVIEGLPVHPTDVLGEAIALDPAALLPARDSPWICSANEYSKVEGTMTGACGSAAEGALL